MFCFTRFSSSTAEAVFTEETSDKHKNHDWHQSQRLAGEHSGTFRDEIHPSIFFLLILGWVAVAAGWAGQSRHPWPQRHFTSPPGGSQGFPGQMRYIISPVLSLPRGLLVVDLVWKTSKEVHRFWSDARAHLCSGSTPPWLLTLGFLLQPRGKLTLASCVYDLSLFLRSLPTAHDHRWRSEHRLTGKSKTLPPG